MKSVQLRNYQKWAYILSTGLSQNAKMSLHLHWLVPTHTVHSVVGEGVALIAVAVVRAYSVDTLVDAAVVFTCTLVGICVQSVGEMRGGGA